MANMTKILAEAALGQGFALKLGGFFGSSKTTLHLLIKATTISIAYVWLGVQGVISIALAPRLAT